MAFYVDPSRRVPLNRNTFNFGELEDVLEWVDFFKPEDALFTISEFQSRTGLDFQVEYEKDFGRKYVAPTDDVPMKQPIPEPSADFKREVLFYWGELQYNPKQKKFMEYTTPDDVEKWNKVYAPYAFALSQMDESDEDDEEQDVLEVIECVPEGSAAQAIEDGSNQVGVQLQRTTSVAMKVNTGSVTTAASRTVIDTLVQVTTPAASEQTSDESLATTVPDVKAIAGVYRRGTPVSPRRTRSSSKLDDILRPRHPKAAPDIIDITDLDNSGRRRYAADREMVLLEHHGRMYAVKAPDQAAAQRRLVSFAS